jgi:predicted nucleotidyltransferase
VRKLRNDGRPIDIDAHLGALVDLLRAREGLVAAYLYGSYGTPYQTPLSDVDLALVFHPGCQLEFRDEMQLRSEILACLREDDVSITLLDRAPAPFQYEVLATGRLLLCTDPAALADFVETVLDRHADYVTDHECFLHEYDQALVERYAHA